MKRFSYWLLLASMLCFAWPVQADDDDGKDKAKDKAKVEINSNGKDKDKDRDKDKDKAKPETKDDDKGKASHKSKDEAKGEAKTEASEAVVSVVPLKAATQAAAIEGTATVLSPDTLIQIDADMRTAKIATDFSKAQLTRAETLFKDKVTVSRQDMETAARQFATDNIQAGLLDVRLRSMWGEGAPFLDKDRRSEIVTKLSKGEVNIVRLDFPNSDAANPRNVKIAPFSGAAAASVETLWPAPQGNQAIPGAAFLAIAASGPGLRQGDRARVSADTGEAKSGVVIPNSAVVITEGRAWCFLEKKADKFVRRPVSLENPVDGGYLVKSGFAEGDKVVVRGAGHLLAREAGPGDDDDDK